MKILLITYSYSPTPNPRAFRWSAIAREMAAIGHSVDIVTCNTGEPCKGDEIDGINVHRVKDWFLSARSRATRSANFSQNKVNSLYSLYGMAKFTWSILRWPDYAFGWVFPAFKKCRELIKSNNSYDCIMTSSHPFSCHIVGLLLFRKAFGVKWLVDIGDPFALMSQPRQNSRIYHYLNLLIEKFVLKKASCICVTTDETLTLYNNKFKEVLIDKIKVIPPVISFEYTDLNQRNRADSKIRLVYVGTLYRKIRSPLSLIEIFKRLIDLYPEELIELHFYGSTNDCDDIFRNLTGQIRSRIFVYGLVNREKAKEAMVNANILINIGNNSKYQLASKLIEYISFGKPILDISHNEYNCTVKILENYPYKMMINTSDLLSFDRICIDLMRFIRTAHLPDPHVIGAYREIYSAKNITAAYLELIQSCNVNTLDK